MVSKEFINTIKLSNLKSYEIAHAAGIHPSTLSRIVCGIEKVSSGDKRVITVGKIIGLRPDQCFEIKNKQ